MKKLIGFILTTIMVLALSLTAFAATVTVENNVSGHVFKAYRIFSGTQQEGQAAMGDIEWDDEMNSTAFLAELKEKSELFDSCATAADVAEVLGAYSDNSTEAKLFAKIAYNHIDKTKGVEISNQTTSLDDGYYLIVDVTEVGTNDSYNAALLQVTGKENITIGLKKDQPTVVKKIKEDGKLMDVADYSMGDTVNFVVTSVVPDMTHYDTYKMVFHDSISSGLTFKDDVTIKIGSDNNAVVLIKDTDFTVETSSNCQNADNCSFEIAINNLKAVQNITAGQTVTITYSATVDSDAAIGLPGNPNAIKLEYSNNPNRSADNTEHETGFTTTDTVIVFTYKLDVSKVDGANNQTMLSGAQFVLYRMNGTTMEYATVTDGKISGWTSDKNTATVLRTGENGLFSIAGIDAGTYYLEEISAPAGYNLLDKPIEFTITASLETGDWETAVAGDAFIKLEITVPDGDATTEDTTEGSTDGTVSITIKNNQGSLLPETGGIGTKIFYVVGAILVLGAGIILFVRKRVNK